MAKIDKETVVLLVTLFITLGICVIVYHHICPPNICPPIEPDDIRNRMSSGEKILVITDTNSDKRAGVEAIAKGDFPTAIGRLVTSLQSDRNDPEALIYLNNAKIGANKSALNIAVSVPIGNSVSVPINNNLNFAKEILRGVAQAQNEVNESGGINGLPLRLLIVNDNNDAEIVKQVATKLIKDASILAVVGHNASKASLAAAPIYQSGGLVMISPTSSANDLSGIGSYIFRTIPHMRVMTTLLARHILIKEHKTKIAICFDSKTPDNVSFKDEFLAVFLSGGGKFSTVSCDLSSPTFNPTETISKAIADGADSLLLSHHINGLDQVIEIARVNKHRLSLFGSPTLYTSETLKNGQSDINGLVLPTSWHPDAFPNMTYTNDAKKLWGGDVNWRSASAYDATQAIIKGLKQNATRDGLQKALSSSNFSALGAGTTIKFQSSGDRSGEALLIKILPGRKSGTGYDFVPLSKL